MSSQQEETTNISCNVGGGEGGKSDEDEGSNTKYIEAGGEASVDNNNEKKKTNSTNGPAAGGGGFRLTLAPKAKKKPSKKRSSKTDWIADDGLEKNRQNASGEASIAASAGPMIIPCVDAVNKRLVSREDEEAAEALQRQASATDGGLTRSKNDNNSSNLVIGDSTAAAIKQEDGGGTTTSHVNKKNDGDEGELDLKALPEEMTIDSDGYQRVPIDQFGAALLRGMGWTESSGGSGGNKKDDNEFQLPRPHRLGLGATPKPAISETEEGKDDKQKTDFSSLRKKPRRPDQIKRDERLKQQQEEFDRIRKERKQKDKQQTLQNGSIVYLHNNSNSSNSSRHRDRVVRAKILQLLGVPGLNKVRVQIEDSTNESSSVIARRDIGDLVPRRDLEKHPFREKQEQEEVGVSKNIGSHSSSMTKKRDDDKNKKDDVKRRATSRTKEEERTGELSSRLPSSSSSRRERDRDDRRMKEKSSSSNNRERRRDDGDDDYDRRRHESSSSSKKRSASSSDSKRKEQKKKKQRQQPKWHWIIPNIRVRVVTEKLGRRQFKEKGVVVDVTPMGATVQMGNGSLLDCVPERYLETALPKPGGKAIVLATGDDGRYGDEYRHAKGKLLERNSRQGVIQIYHDGNVLTVDLDDVAEWCGPLDDDERDY